MTTDEIIDKVVDEWFDKKSSQFMTQESLIKTLKTRFNEGVFIDLKDACPVCKEQYNYTPICINCGRIPLIGA
jgi:hypothetical protein